MLFSTLRAAHLVKCMPQSLWNLYCAELPIWTKTSAEATIVSLGSSFNVPLFQKCILTILFVPPKLDSSIILLWGHAVLALNIEFHEKKTLDQERLYSYGPFPLVKNSVGTGKARAWASSLG